MPPVTGRRTLPLPLREERLRDLCRMVAGCSACPRMGGRRRVLSALNGTAKARVMFVAEAPGRNGAERTGVPIHGDPTGANFERMLKEVGWRREEVFVTNCVLCNPQKEDGTNDTPTDLELRNCSFHLRSQIETVDPLVVVTLGAKPLSALSLIEPHVFTLGNAAGRPHIWAARRLFPLYHPSPRALMARPLARQIEDFQLLAAYVQALGGHTRAA